MAAWHADFLTGTLVSLEKPVMYSCIVLKLKIKMFYSSQIVNKEGSPFEVLALRKDSSSGTFWNHSYNPLVTRGETDQEEEAEGERWRGTKA